MNESLSARLFKASAEIDAILSDITDEVISDKLPLESFLDLAGIMARLHKLGLEARTENEREPQL